MTEAELNQEREKVLKAVRKGITGNIKLSAKQKKYVKNLLLFALMGASANDSVTDKNFIKLVNRLFKGALLKIIKESLDDDDDEDWDSALEVELNQIMASDALLKSADLQAILTPENIFSFLKGNTSGITQKDLIKKILALREVKSNYRETPEERNKRKERQKEYELSKQRQRVMERGAHAR